MFSLLLLFQCLFCFSGVLFLKLPKKLQQQLDKKVEQKKDQSSITPTIDQPQIIKKLTREESLIKAKGLKLKMICCRFN